nr:phosphoglycerate dehydrogenase [Bacteroidota bacterium]
MTTGTTFPKEKIKILLAENINASAVNMLREHGYKNIDTHKAALSEQELLKLAPQYHVVGIRSKTKLTSNFFDKADKLLCVGAFCIGTNQVHSESAMAGGVALFNSPYSNTRSVAELTIAECVMLLRKAFEKSQQMHQHIWSKESKGCFEVRGKTIGIIGYGHIGSQLSVLAEALGMRVVFYDVVNKMALGNSQQCKTLEQLLTVSDIVTIHVPSQQGTKNLINHDCIRRMKKNAVLINNSRGDVVDIASVANALRTNKLAGYAADVFPTEPASNTEPFTSELCGMSNVILTPHIGGSTEEAQVNIGTDVATKIIDFIETGSTAGSLTIPELSLPIVHGTHRFLHIHNNVPGVLSEINGLLSSQKVNILGQYLKTNSTIGYVVLDIDKKTSQNVLRELKSVKNTIKVRSLF